MLDTQEVCLSAFQWYLYIWYLPILNVKVKVIRNSLAKNSIKLSHNAIRHTSTLLFLVQTNHNLKYHECFYHPKWHRICWPSSEKSVLHRILRQLLTGSCKSSSRSSGICTAAYVRDIIGASKTWRNCCIASVMSAVFLSVCARADQHTKLRADRLMPFINFIYGRCSTLHR